MHSKGDYCKTIILKSIRPSLSGGPSRDSSCANTVRELMAIIRNMRIVHHSVSDASIAALGLFILVTHFLLKLLLLKEDLSICIATLNSKSIWRYSINYTAHSIYTQWA